MRTLAWTACALTGALVLSCGGRDDRNTIGRSYGTTDAPRAATLATDDDDEDENEQTITVDSVPASVRQAALAALPGFEILAAETETHDGALVYCLEGKVRGTPYEIEVSAAGNVLEIEQDDDDGDDGDEN